MNRYLNETEIVDFSNQEVSTLAKELAKDCKNDTEIAQKCFLFVRDEIHHSRDYKDTITTCKASEVLAHKTGWCYAKAILLAALLRANNIPTAFCYQPLLCSEYEADGYCLHGLNVIYLKEYGWYRVDARGNKEGVAAQFIPPVEKLAFDEFDIKELYSEPLPEVVEALQKNKCYSEMVENFPDMKNENKV